MSLRPHAMALARIVERLALEGWSPVGKHLHEAAVGQKGLGLPALDIGEAETGCGSLGGEFGCPKGKSAAHIYFRHAAAFAELPSHDGAARQSGPDAFMSQEIAGGLGDPSSIEIGRCAHDHQSLFDAERQGDHVLRRDCP